MSVPVVVFNGRLTRCMYKETTVVVNCRDCLYRYQCDAINITIPKESGTPDIR
jgi:hypothetical protein